LAREQRAITEAAKSAGTSRRFLGVGRRQDVPSEDLSSCSGGTRRVVLRYLELGPMVEGRRDVVPMGGRERFGSGSFR